MLPIPVFPQAAVRGAGAAWSPLRLFDGGYGGFWHDFARQDLLQQNSGGTGAVTADADPVGYAVSRKADALTAVQATSAARPLWRTGGLVRCDGSDDNLLTTVAPALTFTGAVKLKAITASKFFFGATNAGNANRFVLGLTAAGQLGGGVGSQPLTTIFGGSDIRSTVGVAVQTCDGITVRLYWNGAQVYSGAQSSVPTTTVPVRLGAYNQNGSASGMNDCDIYHALAITRALSADEITRLTSYWGTA